LRIRTFQIRVAVSSDNQSDVVGTILKFSLAFALASHVLMWRDLSPPAQTLAAALGLRERSFVATIQSIRARNAARLQEGEMDHLIFYMLQSTDFTKEAPIEPATAATAQGLSPAVRRRVADLARALAKPRDERQRYFAKLVPAEPEPLLEQELARVLRWIREKEVGCRSAPSPQTCIAELYVERGHSSDTSPQSMAPVRAAFEWLEKRQTFKPQRILIIGPGSDFAPRTAMRGSKITTYQPRATRDLVVSAIQIDCVDLNPRVVQSAAGECDSAKLLDIATNRMDATYDAIVATNVLLYLNKTELLLAFHNVRAMLAPQGVFIHNDGRFEAQLFGRAVGLPALHFGAVTMDGSRRPPLVDRFVIHSPAAPGL
jgi:hypothetical protein